MHWQISLNLKHGNAGEFGVYILEISPYIYLSGTYFCEKVQLKGNCTSPEI